MVPVRALRRGAQVLLALQALLAVQAVALAGSLVASSAGRWAPLVVGAASGSAVLAWFVGRRPRSAWLMALGFEALVAGLGTWAVLGGTSLPGAALAVPTLVALVLPAGARRFTAAAATPSPRPIGVGPGPAVLAPPTAPPTAPPAAPPSPPSPPSPPTPSAALPAFLAGPRAVVPAPAPAPAPAPTVPPVPTLPPLPPPTQAPQPAKPVPSWGVRIS